MRKRINVLYQCDNNFAFMAGVSFTSLLMNADNDLDYRVYLLTPDMSDENMDKWREAIRTNKKEANVKLTFLDATACEEEVRSWNVPSHRGSWVTYYKLLLNRYFENTDVERILHIGADTLVTGSLRELADFDFNGMPFAMNWNEKVRFPNYPSDAQYCIAEMVYFNLPKWRENRCEQRIIEHVRKYGDLYGSKDQGILCTQFIGEYSQLPLKYNVYGISYNFGKLSRRLLNNAPILSDEEIEDAYKNPEIIHLARTFLYRPCEEGSLDDLNDVWWEYCNSSPWRGMTPIEPAPPLLGVEKAFRWIFKVFPRCIAELLYVFARHGSANAQWLAWKIRHHSESS